MGRRWSDIPWVVEQRCDGDVTLLARCANEDHARYLARIVSKVLEGDVTLRDAGHVARDRVVATFHDGNPVRLGVMPRRLA